MAVSQLSVVVCDEYVKVDPDGQTVGGRLRSSASGVQLVGCGGEVVSFQVVIDAKDGAVNGVTFEFEPLAGAHRTIMPDQFVAFLVGFVQTPSVSYSGWQPSGWKPDPLFPFHPFDVLCGQVQPVWINLGIPRNMRGVFHCRLIVSAHGMTPAHVPIFLKVWGFNLPRQISLINAFDFSLAPKMSGFEELYGPLDCEGFEPFARFMRYLSDHGVNRLFYGHFLSGGLNRIQEQDGRFGLDLARAERVLQFMTGLKLGFNHWLGPIWSDPEVFFNLYPVFDRFRSLGRRLHEDETFDRCVVEIAADLYRRLERLDLTNSTHAYFYDEPYPWAMPHMAQLSRKLKKLSPTSHQCIATGSADIIRSIIRDDLPIDVIVGHLSFHDAALRKRIEASGRTYWWYTSNWWEPSGSHLSFWVDEPVLHHRILYWLTWSYGVPGFVYWNTNAWNHFAYGYDNVDAGRHIEWPKSDWNIAPRDGAGSGDGQLLYPGPDGPIGSIRFEAIRHGCQDYAYLSLLEGRLADLNEESRLRFEQLLSDARRRVGTLRNHTRLPSVLQELRSQVGSILERLQA